MLEDLLLGMNEEGAEGHKKNKNKDKKKGGNTNMVDLDMLTDEQIVKDIIRLIMIYY